MMMGVLKHIVLRSTGMENRSLDDVAAEEPVADDAVEGLVADDAASGTKIA